jgi:hypothetical protein
MEDNCVYRVAEPYWIKIKIKIAVHETNLA